MIRLVFRLSLLAVFLAPLTLSAQHVIDLNGPVLMVDDVRYAIASEPERAERFERLVVTVPGRGTYVVRTRPFKGATRMGSFRGNRLDFEHGRRSIRVQSTTPILRTPGRSVNTVYPAYVRYDRFGAVSPFDEADIALSVLDVADRGDVRLTRWASRLEGDLQRHSARISPMAGQIDALRAENQRLFADADLFALAVEDYETRRQDYLTRYERMLWLQNRLQTVRDRSEYTNEVRRMNSEVDAMNAEHARLVQTVRRLDQAFRTHQSAIRSLNIDTSQMSAEANALAEEHLRYVVARDRFNGIDTVGSMRR